MAWCILICIIKEVLFFTAATILSCIILCLIMQYLGKRDEIVCEFCLEKCLALLSMNTQ